MTSARNADHSLKSLNIADNYSSDDSNILEDLFKPCLDVSEIYYRSVGFLDSKILAMLGMEFDQFSKRGGRARLLVGKTVSVDDYLAIKEGAINPERFAIFDSIKDLWEDIKEDNFKAKGLLTLSWLVANGIMHVKFALRPRGMHHDKFALFRDSDGNEIVVHGTNNETAAANIPEFNYESLSVFKSWEEETFRKHGEYKIKEFLKAWEGKSKVTISVDAPNPVLEEIAYLSESERSNKKYSELFNRLEENFHRNFLLPQLPVFIGDVRYQLYDHQKKAINAYFESDYKGIFALATGSGKTITSIHAATVLARNIAMENDCDVLLIVSVPFQVLADQWVENLEIYGYRPITAYGSISRWLNSLILASNLASFEPAARVHSVVAVNKTMQTEEFRRIIDKFSSSQTIFIGDECHRLGTAIANKKIPNADYRMGLSATPWAKKEKQLEATLTSYFGVPVAFYDLEQAFKDKVLVPYYYHPIHVTLEENEVLEYEKYSVEISKLLAMKMQGVAIDEDRLNYLLNCRAALLGSAEQKYLRLGSVLGHIRDEIGKSHLLVYCGSGTTEDQEFATGSVRDIERAQAEAAKSIKLHSGRITANESQKDRRAILAAFETGSLNAVFAIKVLDEGFDMPGIRGALLLASSRNERQFIQRRGRVLRKSKNKDCAHIWDYIVSGGDDMQYHFSQSLARAELERVVEFSRLALNWSQLAPQLKNYASDFEIDLNELLSTLEENPYEVV